jgi:hypothetical protein
MWIFFEKQDNLITKFQTSNKNLQTKCDGDWKTLQFDYEVLNSKVARKMSWDETLLVGHFKFECLGENLI